ncbi:XkdW family protein [Bacillus haynesii]|uniref:XkdW family protein n=1 Tax=Bacillus haynesii TaxID=1925021 RepID=UPI0022821001|nr:XkdW family protein [Bacillus haynesii]MCY7780093.1 XkdW family protein [Bacillus haynesii]MCY8738962.1 XkdW family protein [Bacillus haynesii]MCY9329906.1 XkdW family protein [Bacillus haynesii]MEC0669629.1 XkdW family protein [Bacillus haynesii]MEC0683366.1 XkdW family protein [Bacillus haynesii]
MNLALAVKYLFPNAVIGEDFVIRDDGDGRGQYIETWNLSDPQPSDKELQVAWENYLKNPVDVSPEMSHTEQQLLKLGQEISSLKIDDLVLKGGSSNGS